MKEHYFDDLKIGDRFRSEPLNVTEKQVIEFAHKFDPQMFHLNQKAGERSLFKGLIASGWHTAGLTMRELERRTSTVRIGRSISQRGSLTETSSGVRLNSIQ